MTNVRAGRSLRWLAVPLLVLLLPLRIQAQTPAPFLPDFTGLVEAQGPAVVNIQATGNPDAQPQFSEQEIPEFFRRFFGPMPPPRERGMRVSMGSGFILSQDGYVLTNNHVVEGADKVTVRLSDRRELDAKVVGSDAQYDIALLKVDATGLPAVRVGDSKKVKAGQWVVAIGSPFGFDHSVTAGIISAVGRQFGGRDQQYVPFIQTDVAINRGNSGGPLFNLDGEVIGINSQIFSNTGGFMGVSFAIPIDIAMNAVDQLKKSGRVSRGMIGVQIQNVDREQARALGLKQIGGALVNQVTPGSAAEKAGVQVGDVITGFGGREISLSVDLPPLVGATPPGTRVDLTLWRDGRSLTVPVTVGELPADAGEARAGTASAASAGNPLGIVVAPLEPAQRAELGLEPKEGVLVRQLGADAARSALRPGDIILMVGRKPVADRDQFNAALKGASPGDAVMLLVRRGEQTQFITLTVPEGNDKR